MDARMYMYAGVCVDICTVLCAPPLVSVRGRCGPHLIRDAIYLLATRRATFTTEFTQASRARMPLPPSELTAMATAASSRARGRLQAVPSAGSGDDALEDALSALGDFVELAISKV